MLFITYDLARPHFERAIAIAPQYADASENLELFLKNHFKGYDLAMQHSITAGELNPDLKSAGENKYLRIVHYLKSVKNKLLAALSARWK
ncbi:MAG: hypothetical protein ABI760_25205 [Ferruginibacter sp.]